MQESYLYSIPQYEVVVKANVFIFHIFFLLWILLLMIAISLIMLRREWFISAFKEMREHFKNG